MIAVDIQSFWTGNLRKTSRCASALNIHMPEAIACSEVALCIIQIVIVLCKNVLYAVFVETYGYFSLQAFQAQIFIGFEIFTLCILPETGNRVQEFTNRRDVAKFGL